MTQPIFSTPYDHWQQWDFPHDSRFSDALQHIALCDDSTQPHLYEAVWLGWNETGVELQLPPQMMPANGQPAAYLAFWDRADRQLRLEGRLMLLEQTARGGRVRLTLEKAEFWQGARFRLHDRVVYALQPDGNWQVRRLYP